MSARAWGLAGFMVAALLALVMNAGACTLPAGTDKTAALFVACLHAPRPARHACEIAYIQYSATVARRIRK